MRMHQAVQLNQVILSQSSEAQIVIVNFPAPPSKPGTEENCILSCYCLDACLLLIQMFYCYEWQMRRSVVKYGGGGSGSVRSSHQTVSDYTLRH